MPSIKRSDLEYTDELYEHRRLIVDAGQSPLRIDKFLFDKLDGVSRTRIQNAIDIGCILVNESKIKSNYKIKPLDNISLVLPQDPSEIGSLQPENIPLDVVYEDQHLMVINKPPGLVVHPGVGNHSGTLANALLYYFENHPLPTMKGNSPDRPGLVHRIDKDTSGLMLIAKSEYAMTHLAKQFYDHTIQRHYLALVWGCPTPQAGTLSSTLGRHEKDRKRMQVYSDNTKGKWAVTHYNVLEDLYYVSLIKCTLETGRTHQIRVHLSHLGHALFNDERYGGHHILKGTVFSKYKQFVDKVFQTLPRQALHAQTLGFEHPVSKERLHFTSPLPEDFSSALELWKQYYHDKIENA